VGVLRGVGVVVAVSVGRRVMVGRKVGVTVGVWVGVAGAVGGTVGETVLGVRVAGRAGWADKLAKNAINIRIKTNTSSRARMANGLRFVKSLDIS